MVNSVHLPLWIRLFRSLGTLLLGLVPGLLWSQVSMETVLNPREDISRQAIELNIVVNVLGNEVEQKGPLRLPDFSKFKILGSSSLRNEVLIRGEVVYQTIYTFLLEPKVEGKIKIGSAIAEFNGKLIKTEPFDIQVEAAFARKKNTAPVPELQLVSTWKQVPSQVGEPGLLVISAVSSPEGLGYLRKAGLPPIAPVPNSEVIPITSYSEEPITHQGSSISRIVGRYWVIAHKEGDLRLPRVKMNLPTVSVSTQPRAVQVSRPATELVGKSRIQLLELKKTGHIKAGKPVQVRIILENEGAAPASALPSLVAGPSDRIFPPRIQRQVFPGKDQLRTRILADYVVMPSADSLALKVTPWSWTDPATQQVYSGNSAQLRFDPPASGLDGLLEKTTEILKPEPDSIPVPQPQVVLPATTVPPQPRAPQPEEEPLPWKWIVGVGILLGIPFWVVSSRKKSSFPTKPPTNSLDIEQLEDLIRKKNQLP